ncbi:phage tail sheath family protein [Desulfogranum japonicum]|uniref:phage tail sheath family protein n=1 Tax=Desulfogranum japonicum TaxID=231447 RepID=UPI0003FB3C58|nr:phage tail sheath C-terminal domain-containing protein [Desulfogranum japonicum]
MSVTTSYPGVYIEEISSGVRTITGVSTSVAAFAGAAARGPINKAVHIYSFADFERSFGGLSADSEMSYGVRQFFQNGGTEAWVVRIVKDATPAEKDLENNKNEQVLKVTALDAGLTGNDIEVRVDHQTINPGSSFNISFIRSCDNRSETYSNVSMNSADARYVLDMVNGVSHLVKIERLVDQSDLNALPKATSTSGSLGDVKGLLDKYHNEFRISVNGLPPVKVVIDWKNDITGTSPNDHLTSLCNAIQGKVTAQAKSKPAYEYFTCEPTINQAIEMTSGLGGEFSSVRVLPGTKHNASAVLKLGVANDGIEIDGVAGIRPKIIPEPATLTSDTLTDSDLTNLPNANHTSFRISLDGYGPDDVNIGPANAAGTPLADKLQDVATRIEATVRSHRPSNPAYNAFTCTATSNQLILASGSRGDGATISVTEALDKDIAGNLKILTGATTNQSVNITLEGGTEIPFSSDDVYSSFIDDRDQRTGLFALEAVDLFNLLCLPGITDSGTLMDAVAYCEERRAFMIIDAPMDAGNPENPPGPGDMVTSVSGTDLPKSDHAAVYYPWIYIADPLKNGKQRLTAPCGTVAGLYARTDSSRGVWKAPAGTEATLVGTQAMTYLLNDRENGSLNPLGVNCLRILPVYGAVSWGARTLRGADQMTSEYKYVPVRRLVLYLEESLYRGTQWVVFEPNDEPLWAQIRLNIGAFMHDLFRKGAFQGKTPREAYFVKCDKETTTQSDVNSGIVNIQVGFAPLKPAEFVIISIQQMAGQIEV